MAESQHKRHSAATSCPQIALCLNGGGMNRIDGESETFIVQEVAGTLKANNGGGGFGSDPSETFIACEVADTLSVGANQTTGFIGDCVAHALRADGFDASEDGTGRGTPLVAVPPPNRLYVAERSRGFL